MYTVYCDGSLLYDPRVEDLQVTGKKVELEVNKVGTFVFTVHSNHPLYGQIHKLKSVIEVYQDDVLIFRGRPINDDLEFYNSRTVVCEGDLGFLNDTIQRPYDFAGSPTEFLTQVITDHNSQVDESKQFTVGNVTVTDLNDYISRADSGFATTWEVIKNKMIDMMGGYIVVRRDSGINYIDYLIDSPYMTTQTIQLGDNLLDVRKERRGEDIATAIIPVGATLQDEEGNEYRLDIKSVNGGVDYIYDANAVAEYGWIFKVVEWDDVTLPENLLTKAQIELAQSINQTVNIELWAIDKSVMDITIDELRIFEYVAVSSAKHDLNESYLIKKLSLDLDNPTNNKVEIGTTYQSFGDDKLRSDQAIRTIRANYVKNEKVTEINAAMETLQSSIDQTAESIRSEVSSTYTTQEGFTTYQQEISTAFEQTAEAYTFLFETLQTAVNTLDGDTKATFEEIIKYIRFVDGNIELGESGNPITLKIENDRISFQQDEVEVAYFADNILTVTDGFFTNSLRVGNFAFTPRENGNLSFGKVV